MLTAIEIRNLLDYLEFVGEHEAGKIAKKLAQAASESGHYNIGAFVTQVFGREFLQDMMQKLEEPLIYKELRDLRPTQAMLDAEFPEVDSH